MLYLYHNFNDIFGDLYELMHGDFDPTDVNAVKVYPVSSTIQRFCEHSLLPEDSSKTAIRTLQHLSWLKEHIMTLFIDAGLRVRFIKKLPSAYHASDRWKCHAIKERCFPAPHA